MGKYDVVAAVSGDGIIHEILNGFAEHTDPMNVMQTPLCPIPGGSGNALSLNLLGLEACLPFFNSHRHLPKSTGRIRYLRSNSQCGQRYSPRLVHLAKANGLYQVYP